MRVLFVAPAPPWPTRRGYQQRTAQLAAGLSARHRVAVVAQRPPGFGPGAAPPDIDMTSVDLGVPARVAGMARAGWRRPGQVAVHEHRALRHAVAAAAASFRPDVAVVVLARMGAVVPVFDHAAGRVPVVLDLVDDLALNMRRRAMAERPLAPLWRWEARRLERYLDDLLARVAAATVVAERDRASLAAAHPAAASKLAVVPLAVPAPAALDDTPPPEPGDARSEDRRPVALLTGNLRYFPTRCGAHWLAEQVWPRVRAEVADAVLQLAGSRPARALARRAERDPSIRLARDPTDLAPFLARATVALAPLAPGSGTPIKVLEAIAAGVPVVATPAAAEGLDGVPEGALRIAGATGGDSLGDPAAFAAAVVELLRDRDAGRAQTARAFAWLRQRHHPERVARAFEAVLERAVQPLPQ